MDRSDELYTLENLAEYLQPELIPFLSQRDGAEYLVQVLPKIYPPETVLHRPNTAKPKELRMWELVGLHFLNQQMPRYHEALSIFASLYQHLLLSQDITGERCHKGMPLIWMYECYRGMRFPVHAKRYLMLTLCEDAISDNGVISTDGGLYFRSVWLNGISDSEIRRYVKEVFELSIQQPNTYPERFLQELDHNWMTEYPSLQEGPVYHANKLYIRKLIRDLGDGTGKGLENLANYILSCMPGCRTTRRQRTPSTDYDIVCSMEGFEIDFRSELGRYFVCECKDWTSPADFSTIAKFCRVLDSIKSRFGILFSKNGISGKGTNMNAEREQLKIFQDRGIVIVVIEQRDLEYVADGGNFTNLLRSKYEKVRLDLLNVT